MGNRYFSDFRTGRIVLTLAVILLMRGSAFSQSFINGSFETNTSGPICNYNLTNAVFNSLMSNVTAYGLGEEVDIDIPGCYIPSVPDGTYCISLAHDPDRDEVALELSSPLTAGATYTFTFWAYGNASFSAVGDLELGASVSNTSFGSLIYTASVVSSVWTQYTVSFVAPAACQYITVRNTLGFVHWNMIDDFVFGPGCMLSVNIGPNQSLCTGDAVMLNAGSQSATYLWQDGTSDSTFSVSAPGTYWVQVSDTTCSVSDTVTIAYNSYPAPDLGNDTILCDGSILTLDPGPAGNYLWQDSTTGSTYTVAAPGLFYVLSANANCYKSDSILISYSSYPVVDLGPDTIFCPGDNFFLLASSPGASYTWQDNSTDSVLHPQTPGLYWVEASLNNCRSADSVVLSYGDCESVLQMGNVFTPNGDGSNDVFRPLEAKNITSGTLAIYNRWGQLLSTTDLLSGWDGKFNAKECTDGSYYWIVSYQDNHKQDKEITGWLTLLGH